MIDDALHCRLEDWAYWVFDRGPAPKTCFSAEGRYRPPKDDQERKPRRAIDVDDAAIIERCITHPGFPAQARMILKGWYVLRCNSRQIARKAGIPHSRVEEMLGWSARVLRNRLDRYHEMPKLSGTI